MKLIMTDSVSFTVMFAYGNHVQSAFHNDIAISLIPLRFVALDTISTVFEM